MKIIMLTGGKAQGKTEFARGHFPEAELLDDYQLLVKQQLLAGQDPVKEAEKTMAALRRKSGSTVIVIEEMGCGIVPLEREARRYRDANGRVACRIAAEADAVYRVIAGIGERIK